MLDLSQDGSPTTQFHQFRHNTLCHPVANRIPLRPPRQSKNHLSRYRPHPPKILPSLISARNSPSLSACAAPLLSPYYPLASYLRPWSRNGVPLLPFAISFWDRAPNWRGPCILKKGPNQNILHMLEHRSLTAHDPYHLPTNIETLVNRSQHRILRGWQLRTRF